LKRRVFGIAAVLGVIASIAAWTAAAGSQSAKLKAPVTLPFKLVIRHMVLPVAVNNSRPLAFVPDTGNRMGVIDVDRARELGVTLGREVKVGGVGPEALTGFFVQDASLSMRLAGFSQPGRKAPDLTITVMHELFEQPTARTLTIQRGDSTLTVTLTPRVMF
jgi:hypothetical protein